MKNPARARINVNDRGINMRVQLRNPGELEELVTELAWKTFKRHADKVATCTPLGGLEVEYETIDEVTPELLETLYTFAVKWQQLWESAIEHAQIAADAYDLINRDIQAQTLATIKDALAPIVGRPSA